ncbi:hypothetical protein ABZ835_39165 [Streptomyces sp. NPDC047461]
MIEHRSFPPALAAISRAEFDHADGERLLTHLSPPQDAVSH